jgi:hypothetical protein
MIQSRGQAAGSWQERRVSSQLEGTKSTLVATHQRLETHTLDHSFVWCLKMVTRAISSAVARRVSRPSCRLQTIFQDHLETKQGQSFGFGDTKNGVRQLGSSTTRNESGSKYVSPFASFFDNIEKKRTSTHLPHDAPALREQKMASIPRLTCGVSEDVLRFMTTSFFRNHIETPYVIPAEHQITLKVSMKDLPLKSDLEKKIFLQLIGGTKLKRYHPETNTVKLRSHQFASRIENKRHVVSMLDRLVLSAQESAVDVEQGRNAA